MQKLVRILVLAGALGACSSARDLSAAQTAVAAFHHELDQQQFAQIYESGGPQLKAATTEQRFVQFLAAVHRKLGPVEKAQAAGWNVNYTTGGTFVTLNYRTAYHAGPAQESFVYEMENGAPKLVGYHINSDALILS